MKTICTCGAVISHEELYDEFGALFDLIDSGDRAEVSPVEESIYFNSYCVECAKRFLVDEEKSKV